MGDRTPVSDGVHCPPRGVRMVTRRCQALRGAPSLYMTCAGRRPLPPLRRRFGYFLVGKVTRFLRDTSSLLYMVGAGRFPLGLGDARPDRPLHAVRWGVGVRRGSIEARRVEFVAALAVVSRTTADPSPLARSSPRAGGADAARAPEHTPARAAAGRLLREPVLRGPPLGCARARAAPLVQRALRQCRALYIYHDAPCCITTCR